MNSDRFKTPANAPSRVASSLRSSTAPKRDSLAAELERDPKMSTAKRQQRTQAFSSHMSQAALERRLLAAEMAKGELERKLIEKDAQVDRLEADRRWLAEREEQEKAEKETERALHVEEKAKTDHELRELRRMYMTLRDEHAELRDEHAALERTTSQALSVHKNESSSLRLQVAQLERELSDALALAEQRSAAVEEVRAQMDDLSFVQSGSPRGESDTAKWNVIHNEVQSVVEHSKAVERENARMKAELERLREKRTNVEILREEKIALERKLRGVEELRTQVGKLEGELAAARRERAEWAHRARQLDSPSQTPISVTQSLTQLRLEHAHVLENHGANLALLRQREAELQDERAVVLELRASLDESNQRERAAAETIAQLEQSVALAEHEVGFLQKFNASFTLEAASHDASMVDEAKEQHVKNLEELLEQYKSRTHELETEMNNLKSRAVSTGASPSVRALREELEKEREAARDALTTLEKNKEANEQHLETIDRLEQTLFELRGEIGAGRHIPPNTRILSLRDNPAQQWADLRQEALDRLRAENGALLRRLHELEEGGARTAEQEKEDLVPRESLKVALEEKMELEETVRQKEKRLRRLQEVFTAKSAEFREAIASIMGVKLAFYQNGQVRVTSYYDLNASFVFQPISSKKEGSARMQLIAQGEGGPQELPQLMRNWVEKEQCIPCFLASVTLECYESWKRDREMGIER
ncbi:MAD-domain-containing protein [Vararia minispora EC-137]|uniref:MAD-domain-containing protein n=1 Tax=Vararia minispora EC-137 TaxID=1314806 RepID=A0ACB8QHC5_9AGAM|nr:MAD-domain-containing protein [Vararia minispora EC-137]